MCNNRMGKFGKMNNEIWLNSLNSQKVNILFMIY